MILTLVLNFLYSVLFFVVGLLPADSGLPTQISTAFSYVSYQISTWSFIFPLSTVFTILGLVLLIEFTLWTFHGGLWVYHKIRG